MPTVPSTTRRQKKPTERKSPASELRSRASCFPSAAPSIARSAADPFSFSKPIGAAGMATVVGMSGMARITVTAAPGAFAVKEGGPPKSGTLLKAVHASSGGRLALHVLAALAGFARDPIRERTHGGLNAARQMCDQREMTVAKIGEVRGVSRSTTYRTIKSTND